MKFHIVEDHKDSKEAAETTGKDKTDDLLNQLEVPITNDNIKAVPRVSMLNFVRKLSSYPCNFVCNMTILLKLVV